MSAYLHQETALTSILQEETPHALWYGQKNASLPSFWQHLSSCTTERQNNCFKNEESIFIFCIPTGNPPVSHMLVFLMMRPWSIFWPMPCTTNTMCVVSGGVSSGAASSTYPRWRRVPLLETEDHNQPRITTFNPRATLRISQQHCDCSLAAAASAFHEGNFHKGWIKYPFYVPLTAILSFAVGSSGCLANVKSSIHQA